MKTKARRDGDEYVISGSKRWISGGGHAEPLPVYCRLNDEPGAKGIGADHRPEGDARASASAPARS